MQRAVAAKVDESLEQIFIANAARDDGARVLCAYSNAKHIFLILKLNNLIRDAGTRKTELQMKRAYLAFEYASRTRPLIFQRRRVTQDIRSDNYAVLR